MSMPPDRLSAALADRYRIERELGQGGMATVYLAQDLKHDRQVALKVLRPELAAVIGAERFLHEIKTTANLQHPHILPLFDSGTVDGTVFYVMPFVAGETLRDRLTREKQLSIDDAVRISREVASALDYAHRHGVIHRDIKPENILLHDGQALVADFGIALAASSAGGSRMTETGMSLGTPHYMSPEQAMGEREITARSDVYALGCVAYEMLTGDPPFTGSTAQAIVAQVITEDPRPPSVRRKTIPPAVEDAVLTALAKLPADRFASAAEFSAALAGEGRTARGPVGRSQTATRGHPAPRPSGLLAALAAALLLTAALAAWGWLRRPAALAPAPPTVRFTLQFGDSIRPVDAAGSPVAVSPDGSRIAFLAEDGGGDRWLFLRGLDQTEPTRVPGTRNAGIPFFSPQGDAIGYHVDGQLRWTPVGGGPSTLIAESGYPQGVSWGADGILVLSVNGVLQRVPVGGGAMETLLAPGDAAGADLRWPELSVDGRTVFFTMVDSAGQATLAGLALEDRRLVRLGVAGMSPRHVVTGHLVWVHSDGTMMAAPVDARRIALTGTPELVVEGIRTGPARVGKFGLARTGSLAFLAGEAISAELVLVEGGTVTRLALPNNHFRHPRLSPDGRRIAMEIVYPQTSFSADIWVLDLASLTLLRLTADSGSRSPDWSTDGRSIFYFTEGDQVNRVPSNGSGPPDTLFPWPRISRVRSAGDGRHLLIEASGRNSDVWLAPIDSAAEPRPLLTSPAAERNVAMSATGAWLAYESTETGRAEVYLRGLDEGSGKLPVSRGGGTNPRWSRSGQELYYRRGDSIFVSTIPAGPEPTPGPPRLAAVLTLVSGMADFDLMPDGRILAARYDLENLLPGLQVILHRFERLGGTSSTRARED